MFWIIRMDDALYIIANLVRYRAVAGKELQPPVALNLTSLPCKVKHPDKANSTRRVSCSRLEGSSAASLYMRFGMTHVVWISMGRMLVSSRDCSAVIKCTDCLESKKASNCWKATRMSFWVFLSRKECLSEL